MCVYDINSTFADEIKHYIIIQAYPEVMLLDNEGLKPAELKLAESLVEENKELIVSRRKEYFKQTKQ